MVEFYSLLSLLAAVIYLQAGIYVLILDRKSLLNIVYSISCIFLFLFSVCYFFFFRSVTQEQALFALRIGSIGWVMIVATCSHFLLLLTKFRPVRKGWFLALFYTPFVLLASLSVSGFHYAKEMVSVNGIFFPVVEESSPWYLAYRVLLFVILVIGTIAVIGGIRKAGTRREKRQIQVIVIATCVSFPLVFVNSFVLIPAGIRVVPDISHILSLINLLGAFIAMSKYRMMKPSLSLVNDEVLSRIEDFLVILDGEGKITDANRRICDVLGYRVGDLLGKPAGIIILEENLVVVGLKDLSENQAVRKCEISLVTKDGEHFPVQATLMPVRGREGDVFGMIVIGHDRAGEKALSRETQKRLIAEAGEKKQIDNLHFLSQTAVNFIEMRDGENAFQLIGQKVKELAGDSLNIVVSWNDYLRQFQVESVSGSQSYVSKVNDILGGSMEKVILKVSPEATTLMATGKCLRYAGSLYELTQGTIPEKKCERIEKELGLKEIGIMGFTRGEKLLGGVLMFSLPGSEHVNRMVLEAFVRQASIAIQKIRAQEQLATSETLYRRLMETVFEAVVIHKEGRILYVNEKALRMMGLSNPQEAYGKSLMDFVHPDSREKVRTRMREMYTHGVSVPLLEEKFLTSGGKAVDVEVTATGFIYLDTPAVLVMFRDIGNRKKLENETLELQRQIEFILGVTKTGLDIIDSDMRVLFVDPEWKRVYGEPGDRKCHDYFAQRDTVCEDCQLARVKETGREIITEKKIPGEDRWIQVTTLGFRDRDGKQLFAEVSVDITKRKKIEGEYMTACGQIENLNQQLESEFDNEKKKSKLKDYIIINQSRLAAMSEMLQNISHHWREPLNNIGLLIQNIRQTYGKGKMDGAMMEEFGNRGVDLLYGMTRTLDNFANFLKPDRVKQNFCLKEAVDKAVALASVGFREADIRIELDVNEDVYVRGYLNEATQVMVNLLNNSREAVVENSVVNAYVKITLSVEKEGKVLTVTDNGGGIHPDVLPHLFEPYYTCKKNSAGIGLFLSKEFIEKDMEGKMSVMSGDDGVTVRIVFPTKE